MEATLLLLAPLVLFRIYLATLHIRVYWRMLKRKRFWDYLVAYLIFSIAVVPLNYPESFPDQYILELVRRHDGLVKYFYGVMLITSICFVLTYRSFLIDV